MTTLPRFSQLVRPAWLHRLQLGLSVEEAPEGETCLFEVSDGRIEIYEKGHIPGAFHLSTQLLESPEDGNRRPASELEGALLGAGIAHDTTVILYGQDTGAEEGSTFGPGQMAATRAAVILLYAGVRDVRVLDGGFDSWLAAGYSVEAETCYVAPANEFGVEIPDQDRYLIDYDDAAELLADPEGVLVSIRSRAEITGETSGYDYIDRIGDIPGAVWGDGGSDAHHMESYRNPDQTMRAFTEIAAKWKKLGITPDKKVSFFCGAGWRASEAFFNAYLMGWPDISVYDGGWFEWSRRSNQQKRARRSLCSPASRTRARCSGSHGTRCPGRTSA